MIMPMARGFGGRGAYEIDFRGIVWSHVTLFLTSRAVRHRRSSLEPLGKGVFVGVQTETKGTPPPRDAARS